MVVIVILYTILFLFLSYLSFRFIRHRPPQKPRILPITTPIEEFDIKSARRQAAKQQKKGLAVPSFVSAPEVGPSEPTGQEGEGAASDSNFLESGAFLSWKDLSYSVYVRKGVTRSELQLLHDITGFVKPGMMLALMGASGAGKSTLLDVLAHRKTGGKITGTILLNGQKPGPNLSRIIGYVEQQDIHTPTQTVLEAFEFSALVGSSFFFFFAIYQKGTTSFEIPLLTIIYSFSLKRPDCQQRFLVRPKSSMQGVC